MMIFSSTFLDKLIQRIYRLGYLFFLGVWFIRRPHVSGVSVAVWQAGRLLLVKHSYKKKYALPGGGRKRGEDDRMTAVREVLEEVNITLAPEHLTYAGSYTTTHEFRKDRVIVYEVEIDDASAMRPDNREVVQAEFVEPALAASLDPHPVLRKYLETRI